MSTLGLRTVEQYFEPKLLALLEEIYKNEKAITSEEAIYTRYARSGVQQDEVNANVNDLVAFMQGLHSIANDLQGIDFSLQQSKRSFSDALSDVLAVSQNKADKQQTDYVQVYLNEFFHLYSTGQRAGTAMSRVAIHVLPPYVDNALRVVRALAVGLSKFYSLKVCGPGAVNRTDHIVAYLFSSTDVGLIQRLITEGFIAGCIGGTLPPAMKQLQPGVAYSDEPPDVPKSYVTSKEGVTIRNPGKYDPNVNPYGFKNDEIVLKNKQRMSFGEFHTNRIWAGLIKWRKAESSQKTFQFFLFEVYQAYLRKGVYAEKPYEFPDKAGAESKWFSKYTLKNKI